MTETDPKPLIQLIDISKSFSTLELKTHALLDVNLEIKAREYISIEGPSGSGKTTLLSLLGLLESPSTGQYLLEGRLVSHLSASEMAGVRNQAVGFIFQSFNLIGDLSVLENVELPLTYRAMARTERRDRAREALERVGMGHRMGHFPGQLSGGQQQRVAVARAVVGAPRLLLADEPTGNLDSESGAAVMELLEELHRGGTTLCMVTHDEQYAARAERRLRLFDGRIVEEHLATPSLHRPRVSA